MSKSKRIAIVGAGMAAIACARTLAQADHSVTVFEKSHGVGGRMSARSSAFGSFDHGAQYFTVRDSRFAKALETTPGVCRRWSANTVQVLDSHGLVAEAGLPARELHWVAKPGMSSLVRAWTQPLVNDRCVELQVRVTGIEKDALAAHKWQLRTAGAEDSTHVFSGFDAVVLAIPGPQAEVLLKTHKAAAALAKKVAKSTVAPCWTLMVAYPQAVQPGLTTLGPQWNAARSTHHRIAWLARESSKPGRGVVERWTVQASAAWSQEHLQDDPSRIAAKLGIGVCGDWCLGHRVEDAFVSGLELALAMA